MNTKELILSGPGGPEPKFSDEEIAQAREYWRDLTDEDLLMFWKHYTTGPGQGMYSQVGPDTPFEDYLVLSAYQSSYERAHDI